ASRLGAITELGDDGRTGLLFHPGDPNELALQVRTLLDDPTRLASMRQAARATFTTRYNGTRSIEGLTAIYEQAIADFRREGTWRALTAKG
ncbi:MAG TPA: glycosyltransferase, partial [Tepidisphaeraceae bacterium]|nr:glycosyltransferase [Tepidisphaeraceae bacterium]